MDKTDWGMIKHFKESEFNHPQKMKLNFLGKLDDLRDLANKGIVIHSDYRTNSLRHRSGTCVDLHIKDISLIDMYLMAERLNFKGIGIYPCWNSVGLHLDMVKDGRWIRINDIDYVELNEENLIKYCLEELK